MWQFISIAVLLAAPLDLSRRLKNELRRGRQKVGEPESPPLPEPKAWTEYRPLGQTSNYFTRTELEKDLWASQRHSLQDDVWRDDRDWINLPRPKAMPRAVPWRREYILETFDGRYSFHD